MRLHLPPLPRPAARLMFILYLATRLLVGFLVIGSLLPLLPVGAWVVRLFDFPRLQLVGLALLALVGLAVEAVVEGSGTATLIWAATTVAVILFQLGHVVRYTPLWKREIPDDDGRDDKPTLSLAVANLQYENDQKQAVLEQIESMDCDLVLLIEYDEAWAEGLEPLEQKYPHREGVVREKGLGLMLLSKKPFVEVEVRHLVSEDRASIFADIEYEEGYVAHFIGLHPTPPGLDKRKGEGRHDSRIRDAELMIAAEHIADHPDDDWMVTGDFNDVAWSHTTRLFKRMSGLKDPRIGRGLYNTFHANKPLLRFPIDHVFLPGSAQMVRIERINTPGSDHFAFMAEVKLNGKRPSEPHPENGDYEEAEEMIEEGEEDAAKVPD